MTGARDDKFKKIKLILGGVLIAATFITSTLIWSHREICPTASTINKMEAEIASPSGSFWNRTTPEELAAAKSCNQASYDSDAITGGILSVLLALMIYIALLITLKRVRRQNAVHHARYEKLERKASWRFAKVVFWTALLLIVGMLLLLGETWGWAIFLIVVAYPLFLAFRGSALYIAGIKKVDDKPKHE